MREQLLIVGRAMAILIGVVLVLVVLYELVVGRYTALYELPAGYRGWVLIQYKDTACARLPSRGTYQVIRISPSGRACTSNPVLEGLRALPEFEYVYPDGRRSPILLGQPGMGKGVEVWGRGVNNLSEEYFFVGTEEEFQRLRNANPGSRLVPVP